MTLEPFNYATINRLARSSSPREPLPRLNKHSTYTARSIVRSTDLAPPGFRLRGTFAYVHLSNTLDRRSVNFFRLPILTTYLRRSPRLARRKEIDMPIRLLSDRSAFKAFSMYNCLDQLPG